MSHIAIKDTNNALTTRQKQLWGKLKAHETYKSSEINNFSEMKDVSSATLKRDLHQLVAQQILQMSGTKRGTSYTLTARGILLKPVDVVDYYSKNNYKSNVSTTFNFEFWQSYADVEIFSKSELQDLKNSTTDYAARVKRLTPTLQKKELERFVIELSWKSSQIEGNTYTLLDTEKLLHDGVLANGHPKEEAVMIINHKRAFDYIHDLSALDKPLTTSIVHNIHRLLTTDLNISHGVRQGPVGITGSNYVPPQIPQVLEQQLQIMCDTINKLGDAWAQSLLAVIGISYLQTFEDGNKRTARMLANYILLKNSLAPLSYRNVDENDYKAAMLIFYEQNSLVAFKNIFFEQYLFSCQNYNV